MGKIIVFRFSTPNFMTEATTKERVCRRRRPPPRRPPPRIQLCRRGFNRQAKTRQPTDFLFFLWALKKQEGKKGRGREEDTKPLPPKKPRTHADTRTRVAPLRFVEVTHFVIVFEEIYCHRSFQRLKKWRGFCHRFTNPVSPRSLKLLSRPPLSVWTSQRRGWRLPHREKQWSD